MSNVIDFAQFKNALSEEELSLEEQEDYELTDMSISIAQEVIDALYDCGYNINEKPEAAYDLIMIVESIKSMVNTIQGKSYPMHEMAKSLFPIDDMQKLIDDFLE